MTAPAKPVNPTTQYYLTQSVLNCCTVLHPHHLTMSLSTDDVAPVFVKLGPRISLFTPPEPATGELVIICTWLGAARKHILKYTTGYRQLAPHAKILLIESSVSILTSTYPAQWIAIRPAVEVLRAVLDECGYGTDGAGTPTPKIALHTFSNGGSNSATQMLIELNRQTMGKIPLPIHGLICDSGPAVGTYWKSYNSMLQSLPKGLAWRIIGPCICHFILVVLFSSVAMGRYEAPEPIIRRTLLDEKLLAGDRRICYLLSKADTHVDTEDILSHAENARNKGWQVKTVVFEDTAHCNHVAKHQTEYFDAVKAVWSGERLNTNGQSRL